tara:strand:- start:25512 stop:25979 length:468 start_codon:yes stop_codon:yes gene_type:complete
MGLAKRRSAHLIGGIALCLAAMGQDVRAQEAPAQEAPAKAAGLSLELNRLEQNGPACRATLVAKNGFQESLDETAFELVTFDKAGLIGLMTVIDFGALPTGKTLVKRFDLPETECGALTRILVNSVARCAGPGIDLARCQTSFTTDNRAAIEFGR